MERENAYTWINTDILDCEECHAYSHEEWVRQLESAIRDGEANHLATHMTFPIGDVDDEQPSSGNMFIVPDAEESSNELVQDAY
jgi:hypothetical protein